MKRAFLFALAPLLIALLAGCGNDNPIVPRMTFGRSLQTIWPNEDGRSWTYRIQALRWDDPGPHVYLDRDSVPPIPPMSYIATLLGIQPIGSNPEADSVSFQLRFNGFMTTGSGVTAQQLEEIVTRPAAGAIPRAASPVPAGVPSGFLRELLQARPDLAPRLSGALPMANASASAFLGNRPTLFLFGYAFRKTSEWIGSYGDADTALAWKYLTKFLLPGAEFTHQLVPSLALDVYLHGRILDRRTIVTRAGTFPNAVVCLYAVDYGIGTVVDPNDPGQVMGYYRVYSYGTVAYADRVGPVASYERNMVGIGQPSLGNKELRITLTDRSDPAP